MCIYLLSVEGVSVVAIGLDQIGLSRMIGMDYGCYSFSRAAKTETMVGLL